MKKIGSILLILVAILFMCGSIKDHEVNSLTAITQKPTNQPDINIVSDLPSKIIPYEKNHWTRIDTRTMGFSGNPRITGIIVKSNKHIWVNTSDGIAFFDGSSWILIPTKNGSPSIYMYVDHNETLWKKIKEKAIDRLYRYIGKDWVGFDSPLISPNLVEDSNGLYWFVDTYDTKQNVASFDGKTWTFYSIFNNWGKLEKIRGFDIDSNAHMWAGSLYGLYHHDGISWNLIPNQNLSGVESEVGVTSIDVALDGSVWLLFNGRSVIKYKDGVVSVYESIFLNQLDPFSGVHLMVDSSRSAWIAGWNKDRSSHLSLVKLSTSGWEIYEQPEIGYIGALTQAFDGSIWVGSVDAIYQYKP